MTMPTPPVPPSQQAGAGQPPPSTAASGYASVGVPRPMTWMPSMTSSGQDGLANSAAPSGNASARFTSSVMPRLSTGGDLLAAAPTSGTMTNAVAQGSHVYAAPLQATPPQHQQPSAGTPTMSALAPSMQSVSGGVTPKAPAPGMQPAALMVVRQVTPRRDATPPRSLATSSSLTSLQPIGPPRASSPLRASIGGAASPSFPRLVAAARVKAPGMPVSSVAGASLEAGSFTAATYGPAGQQNGVIVTSRNTSGIGETPSQLDEAEERMASIRGSEDSIKIGQRLQRLEEQVAEATRQRQDLARAMVEHSRKQADIVAEACKDIVDTRDFCDSIDGRMKAIEQRMAQLADALESQGSLAGEGSASKPKLLEALERRVTEELPNIIEQCAVARSVAENTRIRVAVLEASQAALAETHGGSSSSRDLDQAAYQASLNLTKEAGLDARIRSIATELMGTLEQSMANYVSAIRQEAHDRITAVSQQCAELMRSMKDNRPADRGVRDPMRLGLDVTELDAEQLAKLSGSRSTDVAAESADGDLSQSRGWDSVCNSAREGGREVGSAVLVGQGNGWQSGQPASREGGNLPGGRVLQPHGGSITGSTEAVGKQSADQLPSLA
eukprot:TRINITY_DN29737_c0_g1_i1.p1 TRINITY_DN29737_c0_g1~~TRINITY_DN29737_c0_g1_i1.p1  ORF type:complete len:614 (+),score=105.40 TRINITY_DN29737_c0_g1_i1:67-1908(+)